MIAVEQLKMTGWEMENGMRENTRFFSKRTEREN
jgi:hypothetical protein